MKSRSRLVVSIIAAGIFSLACSLLATPSAPPPEVQPTAPVDEPGLQPATEPPPEQPVISNLPGGLVTAREQTLTFYDINGAQVSQIELPQLAFPDRNRIHIAGSMPASGQSVPLLYFSFDNEESLHFRDGNGQIFALLNGTSFLGLTGVPGQPVVAFSQMEYLDTALRSKLYAGSIQTLSSAAPVSVIDDSESWAIKPILIEAENDTPTKVWYTRTAYGIGGDIVFEPRKGLFVLDLATGQANTILDDNVSPWAISADRNWVAYSSGALPPNSMCVKNQQTGAEACFPALPASEPRGAGDAFLAPDAQHVAWMEGNGWLMAEVPSFTATVRVGQNNGAVVADLPMGNFEGAAGIGPISQAEPVAWLDNQAVIIQVRGQEWDKVTLLRYNVLNREISYLAPGEFVGLLYP
jgi:hypothetical protein